MKEEKATAAMEDIFSHAVALTQANRLKNTVYCKGKEVLILNFDSTVLLKFELPSWETPFANPVSFNANDYDSNRFYEEDGKIIFVSEVGGVNRKKSVSAPGATPDEVEAMFDKYTKLDSCSITFHQNMLDALDEKLSHIEISVRDGAWKLIQRDIYSGSIIELTELKKGLQIGSAVSEDIGPIGIRTGDFIALFSFNERITFSFDPEYREYATVTGKKYNMTGRIAFCIYDEIGDITDTVPKPKDTKKKKAPSKKTDPEEKTPTKKRRGIR